MNQITIYCPATEMYNLFTMFKNRNDYGEREGQRCPAKQVKG